ncbi:MAG: response regulator transcription factor [Desulfurivibrionaceae bacterium]|nr:response regulator transcription factor [Desulfurivibrionaceae bacterium]
MGVCRVVLADDHALIRHGIKKIIEGEPSLSVIGQVGDGLELLNFIKDVTPDIILLDISMPNLRGIEAIAEAKKICPGVKIIMLTMHKSKQYLCHALSAGADGYILKEDSDTELLTAIDHALQGELFVSPGLADELSPEEIRACQEKKGVPADSLTPRERQVLKLVAEGRTSRDIAELLSISTRTVEHHRANLLKKLNINNTAELIKYAIQKGYVLPTP